MVAAQMPHQIDAATAQKHQELDNPDMVRLYGLVNAALDAPADDPRIVEVADIMERLMIRATEAGELGTGDQLDDAFVDLLEAVAASAPGAERMLAPLCWRVLGACGWSRSCRRFRRHGTSRCAR